MKVTRSAIVNVVMNLMEVEGLHQARMFLAPDLVVKGTRRGKRENGHTEILLSVGKPNYVERQFIKQCKKAGVGFPLKKIQIRYYPRKRK